MAKPGDVERVWVDSCGKFRYPTQPVAMSDLIRIRATRAPQQKKERAVHPCEVCDGWHITGDTQKKLENNAPEVRELILKSRRQQKAYKERKQQEGRGQQSA